MSKKYVITIAREFGSLGRPIAKKVAENLGIEFYDRDILDMAAKELNQPISEIKEIDEHSYGRMKYPLGFGDTKVQDKLFHIQKCIISELALHDEPCIIVGRCSDYILKNMENVFNIYIYAPYEVRLKNCIEILGISPEEAPDMIKDVDKARRAFHKHYTKETFDAISNRNLLIDSSFLGVNGTADLITQMVKAKFGV